jgi:predicted negative regulator of RcsB-dependent stress response
MTPQQQTIETESTGSPTFFDWIQANTKVVGIAAAIVVVGGLGYWFYLRSGEIKRANAERQLNQAKQSIGAGNAALAQTDLQRVATRYKGTAAGAQAAMLLAQMEYSQGRFAEGLKVLDEYKTASAAGSNLAAVLSLTADGLQAQDRSPEAAEAYQRAAEATDLPGEKSLYLARAGRALMAAGKNEEARALWQRLATDPDALPVRNEAEVRLGELTARPAGR